VTGWTWEYIDDYMTLPRLEALTRYARNAPPVHVSAAAIAVSLGMKLEGGGDPSPGGENTPGLVRPDVDESAAAELVRMFG